MYFIYTFCNVVGWIWFAIVAAYLLWRLANGQKDTEQR